MKANAEIETSKGTITSVDGSTLAYIDTSVLRSDAGGTVKSVNVTENQYVNAGDLLLSLQNDDLKLTLDTTDLKLQSLQRQLEIQEEQLTYYKITAPNDGTIASMDAVEGDTVKPGDVLAVVSDMGHMQFSVTIDELDIAKVKAGQKVNITVDALPDTTAKPLTGTVTDVAMEGTSSGGVTTYPVTISLDKPGELKAGMNANAEIMISDKQNVLMVPLEAIQKFGDISFVWVQSDGTQSDNAGQGFGYGPGNNSGSGNGNSNSAGSGNGTFNRRNRTGTSGSGANGSGTNGAGTNGSGGSGAGASGNGAGASGNDAQQNAQSGNAFANAGRSSASANPYYANARLVRVETGINNDTYIEIVSGLQEGETVILPPTTSGTDANTQNRTGLGGMGGFLGGISGGNTGGNNNRPAQYFRGD